MNKTVYEDYKYVIQDVSSVYLGAKYTLGEIVENEELLFKVRLIVERYILADADPEDSLETHLYYLPPDSRLLKIYRQMKAKVKINILEDKNSLTGKVKRKYTTRVLPVAELALMPVEEKERRGVVIQELSVNKLALLAF